MPTKEFDCIEMKRKGAAAVHERLKLLSLNEKVEYWRKRTAQLKAKVKKDKPKG